jgi:iron complex transport system ATP-binding protein
VIPLATQDLTCGYGQRTVLEALSLETRAGEVLVLLGPNGAGKTTLLRAFARFIRPTGGKVLLQERDVWQTSAAAASRELALMPQTERRDWPLSVEESVLLGRAPHRGWLLPYSAEDRQVVAFALHSTGLESLRERPITELSGGEWRRMIFARALAQQASVLLLDEPTAGLDLKYQHEVLNLAAHLAKERGLTVVLTLHDLNHAALYGNRLALISERSVVAIGPASEVITPELLQRVFDVRVTVVPHPVYGTPLAIPLMEGALARQRP